MNLDREEVELYLDTRAAQGFNVIQMVLVFDYAGGPGPNVYGDHPYWRDLSRLMTTPGDDSSDPAEYDYWDHVDFIIAAATARDTWVGVLPIWGNGVSANGMMVGDVLTAANAHAYGAFLGNRYADRRVVWVLGGDRSPEGQQQVWRELARGIASGVSGAEDHSSTTMTYHPGASQSSGEWLHDESWLDFNMVQGGHCLRHDVRAELIESTRARHPVKPFIDAEPIYEDHPYCWDEPPEGFSTALDVRRDAYWSTFAGAAGHTYGHHAVWQFLRRGEAAELGARGDWTAALDSPGAVQMGHLGALIRSRPYTTAIPDTTIVVSDAGKSASRLQASRATDGSFLMVYSPDGAPFELKLGVLSGAVRRLWWFDPRNGDAHLVEETAADTASMIPPSTDDWVLVADDAARDFGPPGT